jgi:lipoyl(octanoyl) transferase
MRVIDLGTLAYRDAWALQEQAHAEVIAGGEERVLFVEHPPVITFGRRPGVEDNVVATPAELRGRGVEVVPSDRGGNVTFHGPGQVVAYPILRLNGHALSVGAYVRCLESAVISALATFRVAAQRDQCAVGVWTPDPPGTGPLAKICAIGVRVRRGATLHGLALNVTTDLSYFDLIVPCGLAGRPVTSVAKLLGANTPPVAEVKRVLADSLAALLAAPAEKPAERPVDRVSCAAAGGADRGAARGISCSDTRS